MFRFPLLALATTALLLSVSCTADDPIDSNVKDSFFLEHDGANMPVVVEGNTASGTLVVILHGGPGGDAQVYNKRGEPFSDPLEERYGMVYWDQRNSGGSTGSFDESLLTLDQFVLDLEALIDLLQFRYGKDVSIFLLGHSFGGQLGSAFLSKGDNQSRVSGWINVSGLHDLANYSVSVRDRISEIASEQIALGNHVEDWTRLLDYTVSIADVTETTIEVASKLNGYALEAQPWLTEDGFINSGPDARSDFSFQFFTNFDALLATQNLGQTNVKVNESSIDVDFTEALRGVFTPAIYVSGEYDLVVPKTMVEEAFEAHGGPKQRLNLLQTFHTPMINQPDELNAVVIPFIEQYQ